VAGLKRYVALNGLHGSGKRFAAIVSGANMNFSRLRFVAERAELGDQKEVLLMVDIPEERGR
jgi:threonine dehydratase